VAKLDAPRLDACLAKQDETQILASRKEADALGIDGTPAVFVEGERVNGGAVPEEQLWLVIDRALRAAGVQLRQSRWLTSPSLPEPAIRSDRLSLHRLVDLSLNAGTDGSR